MAGKSWLEQLEDTPPPFKAGLFFTGVVVASTAATVLMFDVIPNFTPMTAVTGLGYAAVGAFGYRALKDMLFTDDDTKKELTARNFIKEHPELKGQLQELKNLEYKLNEYQSSLDDIMKMEEMHKIKLKIKDPKLIDKHFSALARDEDGVFHWSFPNMLDNANREQRFIDYCEKIDELAKNNNVAKNDLISLKDKKKMFNNYDYGIKQCAPELVYSKTLLNEANKLLDSYETVQTFELPKNLVKIKEKERGEYSIRMGNRIYSIDLQSPPKENDSTLSLTFKTDAMKLDYIVKDGIKEEQNRGSMYAYYDFLRCMDSAKKSKVKTQAETKDISLTKTNTKNLQMSM